MAASGKKNMFNEATRVQMPAMVHLTRLGYIYFGKITEDMAGTVYDPDTNILINVFKEQFARLNPTHVGEAEQTLKTIRQELDNDDIGRSFYERLSSVSPVRLVDFENPKNNIYHFTAEFTCKRDQDEFRPDITLFAKMKNSVKHLYLNKKMQTIISSSILSTGFCGLQCNEISFEYIASYVSNAYFEIHKDMLAHGVTQEAVNNDDLAGVHIIIPEDTVVRAYHEATLAIYAQISKDICENQELVKLRDWLLPMLMNGQATISD